ncbi:GNAT family N-acetyltransferase [Poriferisphaera sp. WC338]|uniref:GNAT family N-acetyltransferase n=1 Tax=Poriferisphaera sp. WC338 TaxID=3425129 RepID=UPI003D812772
MPQSDILDIKTANYQSLTSLWRNVAVPLDGHQSHSNFETAIIPKSQWPNRLWFTSDINPEIVTEAKALIPIITPDGYPIVVPYFDIYNSNNHAHLDAAGFINKTELVAMSTHLQDPYELNTSLTFQHVTTESAAKTWTDLYPHAFNYIIAPKLLTYTMQDIHYTLAYKDNQPVGTGLLYTQNNLAGIYCVGVHPDFRRQGFAEHIMRHLLNLAIAQGYTRAVLQASTMGAGLYRKLGFQNDFIIKNYILAD